MTRPPNKLIRRIPFEVSQLSCLVERIRCSKISRSGIYAASSALFFYGSCAQAATLRFERTQISVSEPQNGIQTFTLRPTLRYEGLNDIETGNNFPWDYIDNSATPCTLSGFIAANPQNSTAIENEDYRRLNNGAFSLTTEPYVDENDTFRFDEVSQEFVFEVFADEVDENAEQIEFTFSEVSVSCAEGFLLSSTEELDSALVSILPNEPEQQSSASRAIPLSQQSLATQFESIRALTLKNANNRHRRLTGELQQAREYPGLRYDGLQLSAHGQPLSYAPQKLGAGAGDSFKDFARLGVFINGSIDIGSFDPAGSRSEDYDSALIILGMDYRVSDNLVAGSAVSYAKGDAGSTSSPKTDIGTTALSLFTSYYLHDTFYLDTIISYGANTYDLKRSIQTDANAFDIASSSPDGDENGTLVNQCPTTRVKRTSL